MKFKVIESYHMAVNSLQYAEGETAEEKYENLTADHKMLLKKLLTDVTMQKMDEWPDFLYHLAYHADPEDFMNLPDADWE